ncbi:hypothetical protein JCM10213_008573 [Rhodosporidiobolus nylandii]
MPACPDPPTTTRAPLSPPPNSNSTTTSSAPTPSPAVLLPLWERYSTPPSSPAAPPTLAPSRFTYFPFSPPHSTDTFVHASPPSWARAGGMGSQQGVSRMQPSWLPSASGKEGGTGLMRMGKRGTIGREGRALDEETWRHDRFEGWRL